MSRLGFGILLAPSLPLAAAAQDIPDLTKTRGVSRPGLTKAIICPTKWKDARDVSAAAKREAFQRYSYTGNTDPKCIPDASGRRCEVDHLISHELGGADVVENLWPQSYGSQPWNAVRKDKVETRLFARCVWGGSRSARLVTGSCTTGAMPL